MNTELKWILAWRKLTQDQLAELEIRLSNYINRSDEARKASQKLNTLLTEVGLGSMSFYDLGELLKHEVN